MTKITYEDLDELEEGLYNAMRDINEELEPGYTDRELEDAAEQTAPVLGSGGYEPTHSDIKEWLENSQTSRGSLPTLVKMRALGDYNIPEEPKPKEL